MSASKIHILRKRSEAFVANLDATINNIVHENKDLTELNKQQLRDSKLADGTAIKQPLNTSYAAWKKANYSSSFLKGKPNFLLTGDLFSTLGIKAKGDQYVIYATVPYGAAFGIAPTNQPTAQKITTDLLRTEYIKKVL